VEKFSKTMLKNNQLILGERAFTWGERTYVMGILNITPDSFSGDGLIAADSQRLDTASDQSAREAFEQAALKLARQFIAAGADILDVGGESTRPGAQPVEAEEELERVLPVVRALTSQLEVPVSIDTYRAQVAEAALEAGAVMVNDVWGLHADPELAGVIARWKVPVVLMHNRSSWAHAQIKERLGGRYVGVPYDNLLQDVKNELMESVAIATQAGITPEKIILDPGIGFGKTVAQNLELIDRLEEIRALGFPVLLGPSRKSFIGYTLDLPPDERLEGTAAAVAVGIVRGADIVRVHDVQQIVRVVRMTDAIVRRYNLRDS
jgi:dihydropteroate synthase